MRFDGVVKSWNDERGFGFIEPRQGGQEIFFHIKAFGSHGGRPQIGQFVTFEVELNREGKKHARNVEVPHRAPKRSVARGAGSGQWGAASYFAIAGFAVFYLVASVVFGVPRWVAGVYVAASIIAFVIYAQDKSAASSGAWRVSESSLLFLGLVGGWPGAIVAQQVLRHKSSKATFRSAFWGTVVFNIAAFVVAFSPIGKRALGL